MGLHQYIDIAEQREKGTHKEFESREIPFSMTALQVIDKPAWSRDNDVRSSAKLKSLSHHIHSAYDYSRPYVQVGAQHCKLL